MLTPETVDCSGILLIQGESGTGKTTIVEWITPALGAAHYDTSKVWRAIAAWGQHCNIDFDCDDGIAQMVKYFDYTEVEGRSLVCGRDFTDDLRTPETTQVVSLYAGVPALRRAYTEMTLNWVTARPAIVSGRHMKEVFPRAVTFHIVRDLAESQMMREQEEGAQNSTLIDLRNRLDSQNASVAGTSLDDVIVIDVTGMSKFQQAHAVLTAARAHGFKIYQALADEKQKVSV